jgi:hypothetical protein
VAVRGPALDGYVVQSTGDGVFIDRSSVSAGGAELLRLSSKLPENHRGHLGSALHKSGEQAEMVLDFGFLKDAMMDVIDKSIDHGSSRVLTIMSCCDISSPST